MPRLALVSALFVSAHAWAAPLVEPHVGGVVFVGATQGHVAALAWNPASAALLRGTHLFVDGQLKFDRFQIQRAPVGSADGEPSASGDLTFPEVADTRRSFAGFVGLSSDFGGNERFTLGLGAYVPYSDRPPAGGPVAYHADGGTFYLPTFAVSASIRVTSSLYAGVSVHIGLPQIDVRFARDAVLADCAAAPCPVESAAGRQELRFLDDEQSPTGSFTLGALLRTAGWWFGAAFTSKPFRPGEDSIPISTAVTLEQEGFATRTGRARVRVELPFIFRLGARRILTEDWDAVADASLLMGYDQMLVIQPVGAMLTSAGLPEVLSRWQGRQTTVTLSAGLEQSLDPERVLRFGARLFGETAAVPASGISAAQVDGTRIGAALGLEIRPLTQFAFGVGYSLGWHLARDVGESAFRPSDQIACNASGFDLDICAPVREGRAIPSAAGEYQRLTHSLHATVSVDFW